MAGPEKGARLSGYFESSGQMRDSRNLEKSLLLCDIEVKLKLLNMALQAAKMRFMALCL